MPPPRNWHWRVSNFIGGTYKVNNNLSLMAYTSEATHRATSFESDIDEVRLIIEYPMSLL
ncbi:hypothetical protein [Pseudomonas fluorescens]|uniref:hypothetical protein n=1 Tax=Pseudomonas fluorescens TaxID=294 RepID=UPI0017828D63|nr:hypothetical protein [Pseudomonas fluorescens]